MDNILLELIKQAPVVGAILVLVWIFNRSFERTQDRLIVVLYELQGEHVAARKVSREALDRNTEAFVEYTRMAQQATDKLEMLSRVVERCNNR